MRQQSIQIMERQLAQMVRLIDDLIDVSRIQRGTLELKQEPVELERILAGALETSRPLIEACGHDLTIQMPERPIVLDVDATRMSQVFSNLLANAAKFTPRGGRIAVVVEEPSGEVVVRVRDSGVGIPADDRSSVFDLFVQLEPGPDRSQSGLGIYLTIVKRLVEIHGGSVEVASDGPNRGSEFTVRLPRTAARVAVPEVGVRARESAIPAGEKRARVLVVDDNVDNTLSLRMILELVCYDVRIAHDGLEALEVAERERPDLILLDIGMPGLSGLEVARRIRGREWGKTVKLVAMTGWGQDEDRRRSREAGFDVHVVKPVEPASLLELLASNTTTPAQR
jgi:CheY-like chemotaxis protein/two-component sensor histidine kinase